MISKNTGQSLLLLCLIFAVHFRVPAQEKKEKKDMLPVQHTPDFALTGNSQSPSWSKAEWIQLTKRKGDVAYATKAKLLYSEKGMYVLVRCEDKRITATLTEDFADLYNEDVVELFLWTDESVPLYFEYELSPLNQELAILVPNFKGDFFGWRPWHYSGDRQTRHTTSIEKDDSGNPASWTAEFFIPYTLLKPLENVPPRPGTKWRMNLYRIDYDEGYTGWTWKPVRTNFHDYERFGTIEFQ